MDRKQTVSYEVRETLRVDGTDPLVVELSEHTTHLELGSSIRVVCRANGIRWSACRVKGRQGGRQLGGELGRE